MSLSLSSLSAIKAPMEGEIVIFISQPLTERKSNSAPAGRQRGGRAAGLPVYKKLSYCPATK
jgi:hypothetical protein